MTDDDPRLGRLRTNHHAPTGHTTTNASEDTDMSEDTDTDTDDDAPQLNDATEAERQSIAATVVADGIKYSGEFDHRDDAAIEAAAVDAAKEHVNADDGVDAIGDKMSAVTEDAVHALVDADADAGTTANARGHQNARVVGSDGPAFFDGGMPGAASPRPDDAPPARGADFYHADGDVNKGPGGAQSPGSGRRLAYERRRERNPFGPGYRDASADGGDRYAPGAVGRAIAAASEPEDDDAKANAAADDATNYGAIPGPVNRLRRNASKDTGGGGDDAPEFGRAGYEARGGHPIDR